MTKAEKLQRAKDLAADYIKAGQLEGDDAKAFTKYLVDNEKIAEALAETNVRHPEYSSALDTKRNLETKLADTAKYQEWYEKNFPTVQAWQQQLTKYQERFGQLDDNGVPVNPNPTPTTTGLSKAEIEKLLEERDGRWASITKTVTRLASRHAAKFGEELDVDAIEKIALEKQIPLEMAWELSVAPRIQEAEKKAQEEANKKAIADGVAAELSKRGQPAHFTPVQSGLQSWVNSGGKAAANGNADADITSLWNDFQQGMASGGVK